MIGSRTLGIGSESQSLDKNAQKKKLHRVSERTSQKYMSISPNVTIYSRLNATLTKDPETTVLF